MSDLGGGGSARLTVKLVLLMIREGAATSESGEGGDGLSAGDVDPGCQVNERGRNEHALIAPPRIRKGGPSPEAGPGSGVSVPGENGVAGERVLGVLPASVGADLTRRFGGSFWLGGSVAPLLCR